MRCRTDRLVSRGRSRKESGAEEPGLYFCKENSILLRSNHDRQMERDSEVPLRFLWEGTSRQCVPENLHLKRQGARISGRATHSHDVMDIVHQ